MARDLDSTFDSDIGGKVVPLALMFYADLPSGEWYGWTGYRELSYDGHIWEPVGGLVEVGDYEESTDSAARGITVKFSHIAEASFADILDGSYWGKAAQVWLATINTTTHEITGRYVWFSGSMDDDEVSVSPDGVEITVKLEHALSDLLRQRLYRWTTEDQKLLYPDTTDTGFDYVYMQQDMEFPWGR